MDAKGRFLDKSALADKVKDHLADLEDRWFAKECLPGASVMLSGSTGWGIPEGFDSNADWDVHVILDDDSFNEYLSRYGSNHVIDDHDSQPNCFVQIRSREWLIDRLEHEETSLLDLWLYENGTWIFDSLDLADLIKEYRDTFERRLDGLVREHFVRFSVRRFDASSSAKRGLACATGMYKGVAVEAALRLFCLCAGQPYPYDKWLPRQVEMLGGSALVELCENCLSEIDLERSIADLKALRCAVEDFVKRKRGEQAWVVCWWEYNEN